MDSNLKRIDGHTIDLNLLTGGAVIDIGCRGFQFMPDYLSIYRIDADILDGNYYRYAITPNPGKTIIYRLGECSYTKDIKDHTPEEGIEVEAMTLRMFIRRFVKGDIDVLKLDIEGGEYSILTSPEFQPIFRQITVEFHEHVFPDLHAKMYPKVLKHLSQWYNVAYQRPDSPMMDTLFVRR